MPAGEGLAATGVGVGVGAAPVRPTLPQPVSSERANKASEHTNKAFFRIMGRPREMLGCRLFWCVPGEQQLSFSSDVNAASNVGRSIYLGLTS